MCTYISLNVCITQLAPSTLERETWSSCRLRCMSSSLSALSTRSNVLDSQHQHPKRSIVTTFYGRSHQRDCVCQQPCTSRPLLHLYDHDSSHFPMSLLSSSPAVFSERVSHFSRCTEPLVQIVTSSLDLALTGFTSASRTPPSP